MRNSATQKRPSRRNPEGNKTALIQAALDTIAEIGITETTVSRIIDRAGLSRGMIHLHFGGKDQLLIAAVKATSEAYYKEVEQRVSEAGDSPANIVMAVIEADLSEELLNEKSVKIWHAFRGEASTNAGIAHYSSTRDKRLRDIIRTAFEDIAKQEGVKDAHALAHEVTFGTLALLEGMWVDFMSNKDVFSRTAAISIICRFLAGPFPRHFKHRIDKN
jgi:AcrR family transcriptional regulator